MDGEEQRVAEETEIKKREGGGASSTFLFLLESKLNPYSALPYADLPRNAPYAQKYTRQYWRQTLTETKY